MRCHICDKALSDTEVSWNKDLGEYEPCAVCLEIALDAAYSGDFKADEEVSEEIPDDIFPVAPILEADQYRSTFDGSDYVAPEERDDE